MKRIILLTLISLLIFCSSIYSAQRVGGHNTYLSISSVAKDDGVDYGDVLIWTDTMESFMWTGSAWVSQSVYAVTDTTRMTAPGVSAAVSTKGFQLIKWNFTIYNKNTSVIIGLQERDIKSVWRYVEGTITYTANGDYGLVWPYAATADSLRLNWSSEVGGTSAIVTENVVRSGGGK